MILVQCNFCGLQDAATSVEDAPLELRCRLVALTHLLPALSADLADGSAHTASAAGPPPTAVKDAGKPVKILLTQARMDHRSYHQIFCEPLDWRTIMYTWMQPGRHNRDCLCSFGLALWLLLVPDI